MTSDNYRRAVLVLPVAAMRTAREWYQRVLGFETIYLHDDPVEDPEGNYAILRRGEAEFHLILDEAQRRHPWTTAGAGYVFLLVGDVDAAFRDVVSRGEPVPRGIVRQDWGARAFELDDPSGNRILVAEDLGATE
jgi:catechol 2,3-dioxygenase-like lactoylglutathione lyase family enzyme